jgi:hypothetical protein
MRAAQAQTMIVSMVVIVVVVVVAMIMVVSVAVRGAMPVMIMMLAHRSPLSPRASSVLCWRTT